MAQCFLILEDGTIMEGTGFGFEETTYGEVVFTTGMTGYQESLTDPSYRGQILIMSYPLIGNYGVNRYDYESPKVQVQGYVVRENCPIPSEMYSGDTIHNFLLENRKPGISEVDTRSLIIGIREHGTLRGAISFEDDVESVLEEVRRVPYPSERNLVGEVSTKEIIRYEKEGADTIALIDCGVKANIIRELRKRFSVIQLPYDTPPGFFRNEEIHGIVVSNGPGDPSHPDLKDTVVRTMRALKEDYPMMGICMGNQLMALAFGGETYKMKFGHRGANQPVKLNGRVFITSQNHGYAVKAESLDESEIAANQFNVNDNTVEGMKHKELPIFTSQYHPEVSPGPGDTAFLFDDFVRLVEGHQ
ncbi:MAG: glutamine-hydrolyzing carbamoyl-phosphate synthase small subunit [Methanomassiliicoccales archaeon]|nr:glutamine-hydrolyzing carbamoyl-phosphate synthase small subunit [Methanomassiliicoccales archaeon]